MDVKQPNLQKALAHLAGYISGHNAQKAITWGRKARRRPPARSQQTKCHSCPKQRFLDSRLEVKMALPFERSHQETLISGGFPVPRRLDWTVSVLDSRSLRLET